MELIESYLRDELSPQKASEFAERIASDSMLKDEVDFHRNIIEGVKSIRKAELKARLSQINVTGTSGSSLVNRILTGATFVIALGAGSYYLLNESDLAPNDSIVENQEKPTIQKTEKAGEQTLESKSQNTKAKESLISKTDTANSIKQENSTLIAKNNSPKENIVSNPVIENDQLLGQDLNVEKTIDVEIAPDLPIVSVPDVINDFGDEEELASSEEIVTGDNNISMKDESTIAKFEIENINDTKYSFNYRFRKGKLLLYGDFSESPYEIIELNTNEGKRVYLYYGDEFYPLNEEQSKIADLKAISDKNLVQELNKIKSGN